MLKPIDQTCPMCGDTAEHWVDSPDDWIECEACKARFKQTPRVYAHPKHGSWLTLPYVPMPRPDEPARGG